jgi:hypothetical protein
MNNKQKVLIAIVVVAIAAAGAYFFFGSSKKEVQKINLKSPGSESFPLANEGPVSPISGLSCENWNRRPIAVMQPADVPARPIAGLSDADMVIEMPVITATITRLMGIYICGNPDDVGSMRSARHDFVPIAKSLDAIFVHWGRSDIPAFIERLNSGVIDNINCNNDAGRSGQDCCYRKTGMARGVDSGYAKFSKLLECSKNFGYRMEGQFSGYAHQGEAPLEQRPNTAHLRIGFPGPYEVEYDYDKASNSFLRIWGNAPDYDRNNKKRLAPKNVAVITAVSEQIEGQYNNVQLGDPWYDTSDSGEARYYINGKEILGTWKKDKSRIDSKLLFYDSTGQEIKFVPGQIWVEVLEPGSALKWVTSQV